LLKDIHRLLHRHVNEFSEQDRLGKGKRQHLYSATNRIPQLQRRFCVTDGATVQPRGSSRSPHPRTLTCNYTAIAELLCR